MSYRLIDSNAIAIKYPEVNEMPCVFADLPDGLNGQFIGVQPERTGKWIYHSDWEADGECGYECSECGMGSDVDYNYCMRCGCRMLKEGEEHEID